MDGLQPADAMDTTRAIGCSGARIVVTLMHEMKRRDARLGLATLCIGVGQGLAVILEAVD